MRFMNTYEIDEAVERFERHPVLGPASKLLAQLRDKADNVSDGWCYWPKPVRAANKLIELVDVPRYQPEAMDKATPAAFKAAMVPVKAFCTRQGWADIEFPAIPTANSTVR